MEKEPYQDFLCRIAGQVDSLVIEDTSAMGRFSQHLQNFAVQHNKHMEWIKREKQKCFKKGMTFKVSSNMDVPPEYKSPGSMLVSNSATHFPKPKSKEEEYQRYYIILASIHDNILPEVERIDNGILPEEAAYLIWNSLNKFYDSENRRLFIEQALERVKDEKPAETEPDTTRVKCWRIVKKIIGWIFKKTSRIIGAIIFTIIGGLIVAILVDIFGDFGWIERIKDFIYEILNIYQDNVQ